MLLNFLIIYQSSQKMSEQQINVAKRVDSPIVIDTYGLFDKRIQRW